MVLTGVGAVLAGVVVIRGGGVGVMGGFFVVAGPVAFGRFGVVPGGLSVVGEVHIDKTTTGREEVAKDTVRKTDRQVAKRFYSPKTGQFTGTY